MIIKGRLHRVTNRDQFITSYSSTGGEPTTGFKNWGRARLHLATDIPSGKFPEDGGFIPTVSLKANADANGAFSFEVDNKLGDFRAYIIAYEQVTTTSPLPNLPPVPILRPFYRSETFRLNEITNELHKIYVFQERLDEGFSQSRLDQETAKVRVNRGFDVVRATIKELNVAARIEERNAVATFNVNPRPSTSHDLNKFVEFKVKELDIDLPGPDFIVGLCVDEDQLERQLRKEVSNLADVLNSTIMSAIPAALRPIASVTVHQVRLPVTGHRKIKVSAKTEVEVPTRSLIPDISVGVPRRLD